MKARKFRLDQFPLVSVVMCVRDGEQYLGEAIRSILNQTYRHFEFIIVNDGSTDGTASILDRLQIEDDRIRVFHQEKKGIYFSANKGCRLAKGKYIARFDADDIAFPERLERQVTFLEQNADIAALGTAAIQINPQGQPITTFIPPVSANQIKAVIRHWDPLVQPTVMMHKATFEAVNGYQETYELCGDYDLWIRISERFKLANLPEPLLYWRMHSEEVTNRNIRQHTIYKLIAQKSARLRQKTGKNVLESVEKITPSVLKTLGISENHISKALVEGCYLRAYMMLEAGDTENAQRYFNEILTASHSNGWRKRMALRLCRLYTHSYKKQTQLLRNILIFSWAVCIKFSVVLLLIRLKFRFFIHNNIRLQTSLP